MMRIETFSENSRDAFSAHLVLPSAARVNEGQRCAKK